MTIYFSIHYWNRKPSQKGFQFFAFFGIFLAITTSNPKKSGKSKMAIKLKNKRPKTDTKQKSPTSPPKKMKMFSSLFLSLYLNFGLILILIQNRQCIAYPYLFRPKSNDANPSIPVPNRTEIIIHTISNKRNDTISKTKEYPIRLNQSKMDVPMIFHLVIE